MFCSASARLLLATAASLVVLAIPAHAHAATINGIPLQISLDGIGDMQVKPATLPDAEFDPARRAGACVLVDFGFPIGPCGNFPTNITPAAVTGSGTQGDPYVLTETWGLNSIEVTDKLEYVNGDGSFVATYSVKNTGGAAQTFRTLVQGNLSHAGITLGQGAYDPSPPAGLFGYNDDRGSFAGLVADTPLWDSYEEEDWAAFPLMHASNPGGLRNTVNPDLVDDWIGVAFDQYAVTGLPAGDTATVKVRW